MPRIVIVDMVFGSHLYGTDTDTSDRDYKGIFLPTQREAFLVNIPKSITSSRNKQAGEKNTADDTDTETYSLQYFIHLAYKGETCALDMLHAPPDKLLATSTMWEEIQANRERFYTRNLNALVGYARHQAAKYGLKGSRLNDATLVLKWCKKSLAHARLQDVWDELPRGEHIHFLPPDERGYRHYQVCGKQIVETARIEYLEDMVNAFIGHYGNRAELAARNQGIDWKAISHAVRAALQLKSILTRGAIIYPLPEAALLRQIKAGELSYVNEVSPLLEGLLDEVNGLSSASSLPEHVEMSFWNDLVVRYMDGADRE